METWQLNLSVDSWMGCKFLYQDRQFSSFEDFCWGHISLIKKKATFTSFDIFNKHNVPWFLELNKYFLKLRKLVPQTWKYLWYHTTEIPALCWLEYSIFCKDAILFGLVQNCTFFLCPEICVSWCCLTWRSSQTSARHDCKKIKPASIGSEKSSRKFAVRQ